MSTDELHKGWGFRRPSDPANTRVPSERLREASPDGSDHEVTAEPAEFTVNREPRPVRKRARDTCRQAAGRQAVQGPRSLPFVSVRGIVSVRFACRGCA
jgi:hypothetical protein